MNISDLNPDVLIYILSFCNAKTWLEMVKTCTLIKNKIDLAPDKVLSQTFLCRWSYLPNLPKICYNTSWLKKFGNIQISSEIHSFWKFQSHIRMIYLLFEGLFNNDFQIVNVIFSHYSNFNICLQDLNHIFCCLPSTRDSQEYPNDKFHYFKDLCTKISTFHKLGNIITKRRNLKFPIQFNDKPDHQAHMSPVPPVPIELQGKFYQRCLILSKPDEYLAEISRKATACDTNIRLSLIYINVVHLIESISPDFRHNQLHIPCFLCYYPC